MAGDTAVKARTTAMITLKATLVTADDGLRAELEPLTDHRLIEACAVLASAGSVASPYAAMLPAGRSAPDPGIPSRSGPIISGLRGNTCSQYLESER